MINKSKWIYLKNSKLKKAEVALLLSHTILLKQSILAESKGDTMNKEFMSGRHNNCEIYVPYSRTLKCMKQNC